MKPAPALTPVKVENFNLKKHAGITLKDKTVILLKSQKEISSERGDILITHDGLSGPAILNISKYVKKGDIISISLSNNDWKQTDKQVIELAGKYPKRSVKNIVKLLDIPDGISYQICKLSSCSPDNKVTEIIKEKRTKLCKNVNNLKFLVKDKYGFRKAMIASGGISLDEVNPKSMESLLVNNLYFAGEILDIDGKTGGFNLQSAFSTAYLAVQDILNNLNK